MVFPLLVTLAIAAVATTAHRRLPPQLATRFAAAALVVVTVAALPTLLVVALAFLAHAPVVGVGLEWCAEAVGLHTAVSPLVGAPALLVLVAGAVRTTRLVRRHRTLRCDGAHDVHVLHSHKPYAVTLPGKSGQIVISTALIDLLDESERCVVLAHERAHFRHRHDRYLLVAELAAAVLPPMRALSRRLTYSIERWADEVAARACGDRELVALTLGKVAVQTNAPLVAGFAGLGVAARMQALLAPPVRRPPGVQVVTLWSMLAIGAAFATYQLHHLERLVLALCPH